MGVLRFFIEHYFQRAGDIGNNLCFLVCGNSITQNPDIYIRYK